MQLPRLLSQLGTFKPPVENVWNTNVDTTPGALSTLETVISSLLGIVTVVGGILFLYSFIQGALGWVTAGGDSGKIQKARDQIIQGAIGLIVLVAAYAIVGLIGNIVGMRILNPADMLSQPGVLPAAP